MYIEDYLPKVTIYYIEDAISYQEDVATCLLQHFDRSKLDLILLQELGKYSKKNFRGKAYDIMIEDAKGIHLRWRCGPYANTFDWAFKAILEWEESI